ncbi:LytR/AlgR family response regulator transcription factor [Siansivirga zeaxanthinifaciens]|uniref:HTH LytTR-type domain-containing protein n=1 Tax=Siansivirga zeaxanthinifaciens CC-SAMT-1 TaxID=1454006 RepID=A0A0C5WHT5_9FLAO|nr:LytTR family transcriptional regulator DNA-binding domain-containing protein [Siansivirga zeaxanthinifaciens]AJR04719.1 hypothetical protein AW14_01920 [Siansivirga zeaxanthinifaciens CC-SAMT-1]
MRNNNSNIPKYIAVNSTKEIKVIEINKIIYLESSGNYTIINLEAGNSITACKNIGHYEKLFNELDFLRIHNRFLINIAYLKSIFKDAGGQYCVLNEKLIVPISNRRFTYIKNYLHY